MADRHDLVIHALDGSVRNPGLRPGEDSIQVRAKSCQREGKVKATRWLLLKNPWNLKADRKEQLSPGLSIAVQGREARNGNVQQKRIAIGGNRHEDRRPVQDWRLVDPVGV